MLGREWRLKTKLVHGYKHTKGFHQWHPWVLGISVQVGFHHSGIMEEALVTLSCWLDLAKAYGSVHHQFICSALKHYHAPKQANKLDIQPLCAPVARLTVVPLQIGVFQGDPFLVVTFNTVMCTLIYALKPLQALGCTFSRDQYTVNQIQYTDQLLHAVEKWLQWSGVMAKVPKSHASLGNSGLSLAEASHPIHWEIPYQVTGLYSAPSLKSRF